MRWRRATRAATETLLLAALLAAGCATPEPVPELLPPVGRPGPALVLAPASASYAATADRARGVAGEPGVPGEWLSCAACDTPLVTLGDAPRPPCVECGGAEFRAPFFPPFRPRVDGAAVMRRAAGLLAARGSFEAVALLDGADLPATPTRDEVLAAARARAARWVLQVDLEDVRVELAGRNGWFPVKIFFLVSFSLLIFPGFDPPNWILPDEEYALVVDLRWRLLDVHAGRVVAEDVLQRETPRGTFGDFDVFAPSRGWFIVGFLRVPDCLGVEEWTRIASQLEAPAVEDLARVVVRVAEAQRAD